MAAVNTGRRPFWWITLAAVAVVAAGIALGLWQLRRAEQKLALAAQIARQGELAPLGNDALRAEPATLWHRRAVVRGSWVAGATVFLDNRQMAGRPGFFVLTPLRLQGTGDVLLVQRGWAMRNFVDRAQVPDVPTPAGEVELSVRLAPPPPKLYELGAGQDGAIRQNIDLAVYAQATQLPLLPVSALQLGDTADGLLRDWPAPATDVHKHHGYAFQWFGLSTLFTFLYVWFQIITPRRRARAHGHG